MVGKSREIITLNRSSTKAISGKFAVPVKLMNELNIKFGDKFKAYAINGNLVYRKIKVDENGE